LEQLLEIVGLLMAMTRKPVSKKTRDVEKQLRVRSDNGDLFIVQRSDRRIALGLIARGGNKVGKVGYFFRIELYDNAPDKATLTLEPEQAIWIKKFGYLHLRDGNWPTVGKLKGFTREAWPMPVFVRHNDSFNTNYICTYDENDVTKGLETWPTDQVPPHIDKSVIAEDGAAGAGYVEDYLMKILGLRTQ
jgi:Immunity protein 26